MGKGHTDFSDKEHIQVNENRKDNDNKQRVESKEEKCNEGYRIGKITKLQRITGYS